MELCADFDSGGIDCTARNALNLSLGRTVLQPLFECVECCGFAACEHFNATVRKIACVSGEAKVLRLRARGGAKEHALYQSADDELGDHHHQAALMAWRRLPRLNPSPQSARGTPWPRCHRVRSHRCSANPSACRNPSAVRSRRPARPDTTADAS